MADIIHTMNTFLLMIIYVYASAVISIITKRRLCLSYRMESSWGQYNTIHKTDALDENWCMIKCTRHFDCWAFNFFHNGTCELLPALDCGELHSRPDSTFVHLSKCEGETPGDLPPRNWTENKCLTWIPHNKALRCPPGLITVTVTNAGDDFCLSLALWKGLYLPGWFHRPLGFRFVTTNQTTHRCADGYVVKSAVGCTTAWQDYTAGDPIPPNAVQVSVWKDGTPLYSVLYSPASLSDNYAGYYIPNTQKVYIMAGTVSSPTEVKMLVIN